MQQSLQVITRGLVPIYKDRQNRQVVDARELHQFLNVGRDFSNWIKGRISKYGFSDGEDFTSFAQIGERDIGGTTRVEYLLTLDMAKEVAMVENNAQGRRVRKYFIECERRLRDGGGEMALVRELVRTQSKILEMLPQFTARISALEDEIEKLKPARLPSPRMVEPPPAPPYTKVIFYPVSRAFDADAQQFLAKNLKNIDRYSTKKELWEILREFAAERGWKIGAKSSFYRVCDSLQDLLESEICG